MVEAKQRRTWSLGYLGAVATLAVLILAGCLFAILFFYLGVSSWWEGRNRYDSAHLDYQYVTSRIQLANSTEWRKNSIDLKVINGGHWQFLCIVGAYNDPAVILKEEAAQRGLKVASIDPVPTKAFGLSPVEEVEGAVSYLDSAGRGRTVLVDGFERLTQRHAVSCFGPETAEVVLPIYGVR